jgi:hypothetical protein
VAKGFIKRSLWLRWLLCCVIIATSLDNVPDPPAIQQGSIQTQSSNQPLERATTPEQRSVLSSADLEPPTLWPVFQAFTDVRPAVEAPLMWRATDSSPPVHC